VLATGGADGRVVVRRADRLLLGAGDAPPPPPDAVITGQHQSGVLAVSVASVGGGSRVVVASGGDDQSLSLAWLDAATLARLATAVVPTAHASAVRGVWTDGEAVVSAGLDRTLHGWRVAAEGALPVLAWTRRTQVPAPAGLAVVEGEEEGRRVAVVGRGCQVWGWGA
jgi:hypothetical protein